MIYSSRKIFEEFGSRLCTFLIGLIMSSGVVEGLEGPPQLECLESGMRLHFVPDTRPEGQSNGNGQNNTIPFCGHIYVKGFFFSTRCHLDYTQYRIYEPFFFHIPYRSDCQIRRERVIQPDGNPQNISSGIAYSTVIIVQHHRLFVTERDKAYSVSCFYKDARNTYEQSIRVGDLTTQNIEGNEPAPTCTYQVLSGGINGQPVRFANIGDELVHKWSCDTADMGMLVHSCYVRDGVGSEFALLDERGCVTDTTLLQPLQYSSDLNMSYTPINAFKFADQMIVYFTCQITLCQKRDNGCEGITPPQCQPTPLPSDGGPTMPVNNSNNGGSRNPPAIFSGSRASLLTGAGRVQFQDDRSRNRVNERYQTTTASYSWATVGDRHTVTPTPYSQYSNSHGQVQGYTDEKHRLFYSGSTTTSPLFYSTATPKSTTNADYLGQPARVSNIFHGYNVAAARHARNSEDRSPLIFTMAPLALNPEKNKSGTQNDSHIVVDVAADGLIIFTKDEGLDSKTGKLMASEKECTERSSALEPLWISFFIVLFLFGVSLLVLQRIHYQRLLGESPPSSSSGFGQPFEMSGFCRMPSTANSSPSLMRLRQR
ncbi:zona pellucida-like domain-containing protein [Ditylenchus destructor]|nr:zona pellucida-like domain-containing protein [Ditylenchus destructor]